MKKLELTGTFILAHPSEHREPYVLKCRFSGNLSGTHIRLTAILVAHIYVREPFI